MKGNFQSSKLPDLVFYTLKSVPVVIAKNGDNQYSIVERDIATLPINGQKLGLSIGTTTINGIKYRVGSTTVFFEKELSNINGSMTWDIPSLLIDDQGRSISDQRTVRSINSGTGDFLGAEGYVVGEVYDLYIRNSVYFTNRP